MVASKKKTEAMVTLNKNDSERYHELFRKLDIDSDGKIDVNDLVFLFGKSKHDKESNLKRAKVCFNNDQIHMLQKN